MKKSVLKNFAKFTGKHLRLSLFFNEVAGLRPDQVFFCKFCGIFKKTLFLQNTSERLLLKPKGVFITQSYIYDTAKRH